MQLEARGSPILGDRLYGSKPVAQAASRLLLHARRLELPPVGGHDARAFEADLPRELTILASPVSDSQTDGSSESEVTDNASRRPAGRPKGPVTRKPPRETKRAAGEKAARRKT